MKYPDRRRRRPGIESGIRAARKHLKTTTTTAIRSLDDRGWGLAGHFGLKLLRVVFLLSLWRTVLPETGETSGMTRAAVLTYTLISEVFSGQLSLNTSLDDALWRGDIANRYLRPAGVYGQFMAEMLGTGLPDLLLFSLPLLCLAPLLGVNPLPVSAAAALLFVCSLTLALLIGAALAFIFASVMVLLEQSGYALMQIRNAVSALLSGAVIPLALMPWGIAASWTSASATTCCTSAAASGAVSWITRWCSHSRCGWGC